MLYDIFLETEPKGEIVATVLGTEQKASVVAILQAESVKSPSAALTAERARIDALVFDDQVTKKYDGMEAVSKQPRSDGKGFFWHCLCDEKDLPADPVFFSKAPAYMKNPETGEPLHTFGGQIREPEQ